MPERKRKKLQAYQFSTDAALDDQIKKIKVFKALDDTPVNGNDLFEKSGLKILTLKLLGDLEKFASHIKGGFVELSTIASTLHRNQLDSFNVNFVDPAVHGTIREKFDANVNKHFANIIDLLRKENLILFNHPGFLIRPFEILNFISFLEPAGTLMLKEEYRYQQKVDERFEEIRDKIGQAGLITPDNGKFGTYKLKVRRSSIKNLTYKEVTAHMPKLVAEGLQQLLQTNAGTGEEIFALHYLNHKFYHEYFQQDFGKKNASAFISVPILDPDPRKEDRYLGIGVIFLFLLLEEGIDYKEFRKKITKAYCGHIPRIVRSYLPGYITNIADEKLLEVKKHATKAAETKILSRNFSHHIGSHVMPNVSLKQIRKRYQELCGETIDDEFLDILKSRLDTYITERNEFLCDPSGSLKLVLFYSQAIVPFIENVLLLDNLCRSEGLGFRLGYGCDILIHVTINGQKISAEFGAYKYPGNLPYNGIYDKAADKKTHINAKVTGNDIPVALPNTHVIFSILENFIRNTAKHQKSAFRNQIAETGESLPASRLEVFIALETEDEHAYSMTIRDNVSEVPDTFKKLAEVNIIDDDNAIAQKYLGIIDFKICAGLLNNKSSDKVVEEGLFRIEVDEETSRLSYHFKILKPKDLCLIGYERPARGEAQPTFDYYPHAEEFLSASKATIPYQFYLIREKDLKSIIEKKEDISLLPFRILVEREPDNNRDDKYWYRKKYGRRFLLVDAPRLDRPVPELLETLWILWLGRWSVDEQNNAELIIYSEERLEKWGDRRLPIGNVRYGYGRDEDGKAKDIKKETNNIYPKIFYSHHGGGLSGKVFPKGNSFISANAFIPFGKNSKDLPLMRNLDLGVDTLLPYWLMEAGLSKILVIDERITDIALNPYEHTDTKSLLRAYGKLGSLNKEKNSYDLYNIEAFWAANVMVATHLNDCGIGNGNTVDHRHAVKLSITSTSVGTEAGFEYLLPSDPGPRDVTAATIVNTTYDAVILHRTFLNDESRKQYWGGLKEEKVLELLHKHFPLVFITSGGGSMNTLESKLKFKFISFNDLLHCLITPESIGKQALVSNLYTR